MSYSDQSSANDRRIHRLALLALGFANRVDYLLVLSREFRIAPSQVISMAQDLGELEDFDGLVSALKELKGVGFI